MMGKRKGGIDAFTVSFVLSPLPQHINYFSIISRNTADPPPPKQDPPWRREQEITKVEDQKIRDEEADWKGTKLKSLTINLSNRRFTEMRQFPSC